MDPTLASRAQSLDHVADWPPRPARRPRRGLLIGGLATAALSAAVLLSACLGGDDAGDQVRFVQREGSRLVKVQTVGLAAFGPINPHTAIPAHAAAAFGEPSSIDRDQDRCRQSWPGLGLSIRFAAPDDGDPCAADGRIETIRLRGEAAAEAGWRTAEGIRPGMSVAAARRIYPEADRNRSGSLILVELLDEIESGGDPVLVVTTARGRVESLVFPIDGE